MKTFHPEDADFISGSDEGWAMSKPNENLQFCEKNRPHRKENLWLNLT